MKLDLTKFEAFPAETAVKADSVDLNLQESGVSAVEAITVRLSIQQSGEEYFCQGTVEATATVECARCLQPNRTKISEETDFIVCPEGLHDHGPDAPVDDEEYLYYTGSVPVVELDPIVREAVILGIGMKPVCIDDPDKCRERQAKLARPDGVVTEDERIDPRWEGLRKFKDSHSGHK
jgi:uncharacterized protein